MLQQRQHQQQLLQQLLLQQQMLHPQLPLWWLLHRHKLRLTQESWDVRADVSGVMCWVWVC
jgi:hypothetical protein